MNPTTSTVLLPALYSEVKCADCQQLDPQPPTVVNTRQQAAQARAARERQAQITEALTHVAEVEAKKKAEDKNKARSSTTEPEARVMKMADRGFRPPACNGQFCPATASQIIVGVFQKVNFLPKSHFLEQLRREERLVYRSNTPLSIALLRFNDKEGGEFSNITVVLEQLKNKVRETDILGYLGENIIGILLPATDEKGAQQFKKKMININTNPLFSISTATYPDLLFSEILAENQNQADCYPLLLDDSAKSNRFGYSLKRSLDIVGALVAILLFSPLMLITALAVKITSPGPIIFKQTRVGRNGILFTFYKFRSMLCNTDDRIHRDYITHLIQGNLEQINNGNKEKPLYKIKSDPRVTRLGRIIRKTSIDELPQLFNVLKGEMSLVGPRPPLPYEVEKYKPWHLRRVLEMRPGITGLWQVDGRSATSFDDMVRFDIRYIQNWSLMLDIKILLKTIKAVLRFSGAV